MSITFKFNQSIEDEQLTHLTNEGGKLYILLSAKQQREVCSLDKYFFNYPAGLRLTEKNKAIFATIFE